MDSPYRLAGFKANENLSENMLRRVLDESSTTVKDLAKASRMATGLEWPTQTLDRTLNSI
ncbi:MAG: hypothetical protein M1840_002166 [Geoglossum simile]|nr:MAG: hypothetical protein M1840_002166 [Geoglossum simile]